MLSVQGKYHQGSTRYIGSGRQCVATSASAMIYTKEKLPNIWTPDDVDKILDKGDQLYSSLATEKYLLISDLPSNIEGYSFVIEETYSGTITAKTSNGPFKCIEDALRCLDTFAFLTVDCYTMAVMKFDCFYVFDSHSRDEFGISNPDGVATVTRHKTLHDICIFIQNLSNSLFLESDNKVFEITHVKLTSKTNTVSYGNTEYSSSSEFSGFSEMSEGEISCRMFIAHELLNNENQSSFSELELSNTDTDSYDDIPLSMLKQKIVSPVSNEVTVCNEVISEPDDSSSEICSSESEYKFTSFEKRLLDTELTSSEITSTDEENYIPLSKLKKKKKKNLQKVKEPKLVLLEIEQNLVHVLLEILNTVEEIRNSKEVFSSAKILLSVKIL